MAKGTTSNVTRKTARSVVAGKTAVASDVAPLRAVAPSPEAVARRAYAIYVEEGRPEGRHMEHWLRAEAEFSGIAR